MKILIVEDERKIALALKRGFEQERMSVEIYYDGEEGLAAASAAESTSVAAPTPDQTG